MSADQLSLNLTQHPIILPLTIHSLSRTEGVEKLSSYVTARLSEFGLGSEEERDIAAYAIEEVFRISLEEHIESVQALAVTIARREALKRSGRLRRYTSLDTSHSDEETSGLGEFIEVPGPSLETQVVQKQLLLRALEKLSSEEQKLIQLRYEEGQTFEQISNHLGLSIATAYKHTKKALEKMRRVLNE